MEASRSNTIKHIERNSTTIIHSQGIGVKAMVDDNRQGTLLELGFVSLGSRQQGMSVILRDLILPGRLDLLLIRFTIRDVTIE